jgi:DNA (cytosine-5)-methyltransferase 1
MRAVDLFAGAGGFTLGASRAGADVRWAANHWQLAVDVHAARHPGAVHSCQDLQQADFTVLPEHDLLLASPACQGHSNAGQGARGKWGLDWSHHDATRATAWAVVSAAEAGRPEWLVIENVPRFRDWALFACWRSALETLGYVLEDGVINAADFGIAQERRRLIVVGRLGQAPGILDRLPAPTPWLPMRAILDLDLEAGWAPVASKSAGVQARIARSRARHGDLFFSQDVRDHMGRSLDQPLPTITTADQYKLVRGDQVRQLTIPEQLRAQGFPGDYFEGVPMRRKDATRLLGNAIPPQLAEGVVATVLAA